MRILFLPSSFLPESIGGTEKHVHLLSGELTQMGHEVRVAYHGARKQERTMDGYRVSVLSPLKTPTRQQLYANSFGSCNTEFRNLLDEFKPDLIHFHAFTLGAGIDYARESLTRKIPYFVTYHVPNISCMQGTMLRMKKEVCDGKMVATTCARCVLHSLGVSPFVSSLLGKSPIPVSLLPDLPLVTKLAMPDLLRQFHSNSREFLQNASAVMTFCQWGRGALLRNGVAPEKVVDSFLALEGKSRTRTLRLPLPKDRRIRIGWLGRIVPQKGLGLLLEALPILRKSGIDFACEICGPLDGSPVAPGNGNDPSLNLRFVGMKQGEDLARWLSNLDLLVIPSRWLETGPYVLMEAWDESTPAIGSDLGGLAERFSAANIKELLFEPDNPEALVQAILRARDWNRPAPDVIIPGLRDLAESMQPIYAERIASHSA